MRLKLYYVETPGLAPLFICARSYDHAATVFLDSWFGSFDEQPEQFDVSEVRLPPNTTKPLFLAPKQGKVGIIQETDDRQVEIVPILADLPRN